MKKLSLILGLSILAFSLFPGFSTKAQTCNPDALVPVSYGQRGEAVRNAQACLMEAGYDIPAGATGYYGSQTKAAVRAFYAGWYGSWSGNSLGPRGVQQLKSLLAEAPSGEQPSQPSQPSQQDQTTAIVAAVLAALQQMGVLPSTSTQQQQQATEGFLTVEQDPTVTGVTLREGETGKVFGLRFRADNGPVTVQSVFLRWDGNTAPYRVISKLEVVDDQNNVLYSRNVDSTTFLQDSSLNYYLPVTGLNYQVQTNQYRSLFVQVTVVGTLPTGVNSLAFHVNQNDVRARDGLGIDRFGPTSQIGPVSVTLQASLAGSAYWVVAKNANSPLDKFVIGDPTNGNAYKVPVLVLDVTAKNDNLRLTQVTASVTGNATVTSVYLSRDAAGTQVLDVRPASTSVTFNTVPANFTINNDQTVQLYVLADVVAPASGVATFTVKVATTTGQNRLGGSISNGFNIVSGLMNVTRVAPEVQLVSMTTNYTPPSQTASSSYSVSLTFNVTPRGGTIYMGTTTAPTTTFLGLQLQKDSGATSTPNGGVVVQLKQGSTDITNTQPVGSSSGWYQLSEGTTYTFVVTANQNGAPSGTTGLYRWIVNYLRFRQTDSGSNLDVPGVSQTWFTGYTNVQ